MKMGYNVWLSERVKELLDEGTMSQLFSIIEEDLTKEWMQSPSDQPDERERLYNQIHALNLMRIRMETLINNLRFDKDRL